MILIIWWDQIRVICRTYVCVRILVATLAYIRTEQFFCATFTFSVFPTTYRNKDLTLLPIFPTRVQMLHKPDEVSNVSCTVALLFLFHWFLVTGFPYQESFAAPHAPSNVRRDVEMGETEQRSGELGLENFLEQVAQSNRYENRWIKYNLAYFPIFFFLLVLLLAYWTFWSINCLM